MELSSQAPALDLGYEVALWRLRHALAEFEWILDPEMPIPPRDRKLRKLALENPYEDEMVERIVRFALTAMTEEQLFQTLLMQRKERRIHEELTCEDCGTAFSRAREKPEGFRYP